MPKIIEREGRTQISVCVCVYAHNKARETVLVDILSFYSATSHKAIWGDLSFLSSVILHFSTTSAVYGDGTQTFIPDVSEPFMNSLVLKVL